MKRCRWSSLAVLLVFILSGNPITVTAQEEGNPVDIPRLERSAERGDADAQFELGIRLLGGQGLEKDEMMAAVWLQRAAGQNHLDAMNAMGTLYETGTAVEPDAKQAVAWYRKAADYGHPLAQLNLAECYELGKGVEKDPQQAVEWLRKAAYQDLPGAQALYAWKLESGDSIEKNTKEAAQWYLRAAQNGLVRAMTRLAYLYYTGKGVPLDYYRAEAWYRRAARSDDPMARNDLAWFLSVCPDKNFHDGNAAVDVARSSLASLKEEDYQVVDTLAAALARNGKYGEAVQVQIKAIVMFDEAMKEKKNMSDKAKTELEEELSERLKIYKSQQPYTEAITEPEKGTRPLSGDRILQEEFRPKKPKQREADRDSDSAIIS